MNPRRRHVGRILGQAPRRALVRAAIIMVPWLLLAGPAAVAAPPAADSGDTRLEATYSIIIKGITLGHATAETRLAGDDYAIAIRGTISGLLRIFVDLTANLAGRGRIEGNRILPSSYDFVTTEGKNEMRVRMALDKGNVTDVSAAPPAKPLPDRIPISDTDKREIVDPVAAFLVPIDPAKIDGDAVCNRVVKVFDGWQRFDLRLSYKDTRKIKRRGDGYAGDVYRCSARYVPISGHSQGGKEVRAMTDNKRLEVWLAPVAGTRILAPYKILIGDTNLGDLVVVATRFVVEKSDDRASAN
jgi:hypothetical protein